MSILVYDKIWAREPRLMVPGMAPVGPVRYEGPQAAVVWLASPKLTRLLVGGRDLSVAGAPSFSWDTGYPTMRRAAENIHLYGASWAPIVTSDGAGAGGFTALVVYIVKQIAGISVAFSQRSNTGGAYSQFWIGFNSSATGTLEASSVACITYGSAYHSVALASAIGVGGVYCTAMSRIGNRIFAAHKNLLNGSIMTGEASGTAKDILAADSELGIGVARPTGYDLTDSVIFTQAHNFGMPDSALLEIVNNPFMYLIPA